ncbi:MAG: Lrp/AsnC family transcriptional regulator [Dokdonella sp.]|uniref:Lrp/AsnC family transcriptional regulator n=1 Tax=Dokdonella sp. TaxID=2291710 RepID=UPI0025C42F37|nr:Lrp/AsnC family transcriptional regulator [Dokdonella sp.]MBZ0222272.1 Lrp/AsnC family transcriptional regulator [Dokdonella sp.]MCC7255466.1 Lrp/AsnC family transcriptional regulator [Dokdonella sp.]
MVKVTSQTANELDALDWQILDELQQDGRITFTELGRRVGLSTPAVAERVRQLEAAGVILGYRAQVDLARIGRPILAIVRMNVVGDVLARVTTTVREMPEVLECYRGTGADSFTAKVAVASIEDLEQLIDQLTPFGTTSTSIVLSMPVPNRALAPPRSMAVKTRSSAAPRKRARTPR